MGFTPLEGLLMGTRSGDLDPALIGYLARREGVTAAEVERVLNEESGLLGLSGSSRDMRDLIAARETDPRARLAVDVFCYRARKYLGAYLAVLGGARAVVCSPAASGSARPRCARRSAGTEPGAGRSSIRRSTARRSAGRGASAPLAPGWRRG